MRPFIGVTDPEIHALTDDFTKAIEKRRREYKNPGDPIYSDDEILCALEIVRTSIIIDATLTERENRQR